MGQIIKSTGILTVIIGTLLTAVCFVFRNQMVAAFINDATLISFGQKMVNCIYPYDIFIECSIWLGWADFCRGSL